MFTIYPLGIDCVSENTGLLQRFLFPAGFCFGDTMIEIGDKFGRWRVTSKEFFHAAKPGKAYKKITCICSCGTEKVVRVDHLTTGNSKSCGCRRAKVCRGTATTHGQTGTRMHRVWLSMIQRCRDAKCNAYKRYGGRGIKVCASWLDSFTDFHRDMADGYEDHLTLDRFPDNDGDYEKDNCRWATYKQQANNKSNNKMLTFDNRTMSLSMWAEEAGINYYTLKSRLSYGWSVGKALTEPVRRE